MEQLVKIRYKTDAQKEDSLQWRVIINGIEHHASEVLVWCPTYTTKDLMPSGEEKWHITCHPSIVEWDGETWIIK